MKNDDYFGLARAELSAVISAALLLLIAAFTYLKRNDCNYSNVYLKISMILAGLIVGVCLGLLLYRKNKKRNCNKKKQLACVATVFLGVFQIIFSFVNLLRAPLDTTIIQLDFFELNFFIIFSANLILLILSIYILTIKEE